jgi:MoaA/NifB/PqqE/SkfB family radical SAM enzyme
MKEEKIGPYIYIGATCNNNCIFCSEADGYLKKYPPRSTKEVKGEILKIRKTHDFICFMGQEPVLRKDFLELIAFAERLNFNQISVASNGRLFSYPEFVKKCLEAGINQFGVSFNSADKEIHDKMTAVPGSFDQTVEGMKNILRFKKADQSLLINIPLSQINFPSLEETLDFLIDLGVREVNFLLIEPLSRRSRSKKIVCEMTQLGIYISNVLKKKKYSRSDLKFLLVEFVPCSLPNEIRHLSFPCLEKNPNKIRIDLCKKCSFRSSCSGVIKDYLDLYGQKNFRL